MSTSVCTSCTVVVSAADEELHTGVVDKVDKEVAEVVVELVVSMLGVSLEGELTDQEVTHVEVNDVQHQVVEELVVTVELVIVAGEDVEVELVVVVVQVSSVGIADVRDLVKVQLVVLLTGEVEGVELVVVEVVEVGVAEVQDQDDHHVDSSQVPHQLDEFCQPEDHGSTSVLLLGSGAAAGTLTGTRSTSSRLFPVSPCLASSSFPDELASSRNFFSAAYWVNQAGRQSPAQ